MWFDIIRSRNSDNRQDNRQKVHRLTCLAVLTSVSGLLSGLLFSGLLSSGLLSSGLLISGLLFPTESKAEFSRGPGYQPKPEASRYRQRKQYQDIVYWIKTGQRSRYLRAEDQLKSYPLYPYLEYTDKIYRLSRQSPDSISAFMKQYSDTPLANQLLQNWLFSLAKRGEWQLFLDHYDVERATRSNSCFYGYALYRQGRVPEALNQAQRLWLVDFSQPDECDSIFKVWREDGGLNPEYAWQRYSLALQANKIELAKYLTRFLDRDDKKYASSFQLVHRRPANVQRFGQFNSQDPKIREIVLHGIKRLARVKPDQALETLRRYESIHAFDTDNLTAAYVYVGKQIARSEDEKNQIEDLPVNLRDHPDLTEARIRMALRQGDKHQVLVLIDLLPVEMQEQTGWQYWRARILMESSNPAERTIGDKLLSGLADSRSFYGFMAADSLAQNYNFDDVPSSVTTHEVSTLEGTPGIQRALELLTLKERTRARREWNFATRDFSAAENRIAARVALKWGWYKPAIQSLIEAEDWNDLEFRFPIAYPAEFISSARVADIPVYWSFAVARQESAFMPDAKSPKGAYGLMQLLPSTARLMARRAGVSLKSNRQLTDPSLNIRLGSEYLGSMLRRYENNRILASAAYNAGPRNVDSWLNPELALDVWIETIPFRETRNYVKNVLLFSTIYGRRMKQSQPMIYNHEFEDFSRPSIETQASSAQATGSLQSRGRSEAENVNALE